MSTNPLWSENSVLSKLSTFAMATAMEVQAGSVGGRDPKGEYFLLGGRGGAVMEWGGRPEETRQRGGGGAAARRFEGGFQPGRARSARAIFWQKNLVIFRVDSKFWPRLVKMGVPLPLLQPPFPRA